MTLESKKKRNERKRAKAMRKWELGTHQPEGVAGAASGAADPAENVDPCLGSASSEDESSDGGGRAATALPGSKRSALSRAFGRLAAAEEAAAAAGTTPARLLNPHALALSESLRFLRRQLREYLVQCAADDVLVTMYDAGDGVLYPTEQWTVHFFKWLRVRV